jgi:hypothetical protein
VLFADSLDIIALNWNTFTSLFSQNCYSNTLTGAEVGLSFSLFFKFCFEALPCASIRTVHFIINKLSLLCDK